MSGMRIVKVMPFFVPATRFGGVVTQAAKMCERLAARGHAVRVVTTDNGVDESVPRAQWIAHDGYQVYYAKTLPLHRIPPYWSPTMRPALEETLADADVCALNVGLTLANRLAARIARHHRVPYVYNAEGALCPFRLHMKSLRKHLFLRFVERGIVAGAAACQAVTRKEVSDLSAQGSERTWVIPNGIEPFEPGDGAAFRARFGIGAEEQLVLFLGRLHVVKGLDLLVEVFVKLAPENARLVIAGHEEDGTGRRIRTQLEAWGVGDKIRFTGHLEVAARRDALTAADLFVLTSESEGLPNAVLEALAAGVPCLLTNPCHVPEVEDAGAGRVVPVEVEPIESALREMLADPEELRRMGDRARTLAEERFALEHVVDHLEDLYSSIR